MPINAHYVPIYKILVLSNDGTSFVSPKDIPNNFDKSNSNVWIQDAAYLYDDEGEGGEGNSDFIPGASTLTLDFPNFSSFAKSFHFSEIIYTSNLLLMFQRQGESGGSIGKVYRLVFDDFPPLHLNSFGMNKR